MIAVMMSLYNSDGRSIHMLYLKSNMYNMYIFWFKMLKNEHQHNVKK